MPSNCEFIKSIEEMMEFEVFNLNCWGIPIVAKNRKNRMRAIAEALATSHYDVVCLQEVWRTSDFNLIKEKVSAVLPYSHYFYSGVVGSGICILSRHPFVDAFYHQWPLNGYIHKLHHGDWFAGKGVGLCKLKVNNLNINIYTAHLHAEYNRNCDEYQTHRVLQAFDTAQIIQLTSGGADVVILAGDLNTEPGDLAYKLILGIPGLKDAFTEFKEVGQSDIATCDSLSNSYTPKYNKTKKIPGKRIDYILYHSNETISLTLTNYKLPLPKIVPDCSYSYSDHEAISASFLIEKIESNKAVIDLDFKRAVFEETIQVFEQALINLRYHQLIYSTFAIFLIVIILMLIILVDGPINNSVLYDLVKVVITFLIFYFLIMATFWNRIEKHAVIAGKLALEVGLKSINKS